MILELITVYKASILVIDNGTGNIFLTSIWFLRTNMIFVLLTV